MCLACEQDAIWLAYLDSRGLLTPDDPAAADALFAAFPVQPVPVRDDAKAGENKGENANPFSCDDPTDG